MPLFAIIARDGKDAEALERRMAARDQHIADFKAGLESGQNLLGGAILNDNEQMAGSIVIADFPDRSALDAWLKADAYIEGNVWQDIEVLPFKLAGMKAP